METSTTESRKQIKDIVSGVLRQLGARSAVVLLDFPGLCRVKLALGKMQLDDHVRIGSITKTFTGTLVLQLVDQGRVRLDAPIDDYLPHLHVPNGGAITVRQLLHMTSGLYDYTQDEQLNRALDSDPTREWTPKQLLRLAFRHPPYFAPGTGFAYSSTNSVLLGLLVAHVTGQPLRRVMQERIFQPLKLLDTTFPRRSCSELPVPHPQGYRYGTNAGSLTACDAAPDNKTNITKQNPSWAWSAGAAISTARDLARWIRMVAEGRLLSRYAQAQRLQWIAASAPSAVASPQQQQQQQKLATASGSSVHANTNATTNANATTADATSQVALYGLHLANFSGFVGHNGDLQGFSSFAGYCPVRRATLVILVNVYPALQCKAPADQVAHALIQLYNTTPPTPTAEATTQSTV